MPDENLKQMQDQAADLGKAGAQREAEAAARLATARRAAEERVIRWDRAMQRAFKGIVPRPQRRRAMVAAAERAEANDA